MFTITKQFAFEAAHRLIGLGHDHPCAQLHGHSYRVELVFESRDLDRRGFAWLDYRDLDAFKRHLDDTYDHAAILHADDPILGPTPHGMKVVVLDCNPTAENLAYRFWLDAHKLGFAPAAVRVSETVKTWAEYRES